ncbi:hypothetical protein [Mesorhizobium sp. 131-3-5]|nr:hypothetical protein [Mesorhizobium sp. 131-3-5]
MSRFSDRSTSPRVQVLQTMQVDQLLTKAISYGTTPSLARNRARC